MSIFKVKVIQSIKSTDLKALYSSKQVLLPLIYSILFCIGWTIVSHIDSQNAYIPYLRIVDVFTWIIPVVMVVGSFISLHKFYPKHK